MTPNYNREVILNPKGDNRRTVTLNDISIPDLFNASLLLHKQGYHEISDQVLECWQLAHDLKLNLAGDTKKE